MKKIIITLFCLSLMGCGFHLRGHVQLPPQLKVIYLQSSSPYSSFTRNLRATLLGSHIRIVKNPSDAPITLHITQNNFSIQETSVGVAQSARNYIANRSISYTLEDSTGKTLYGPKTINDQQNIAAEANEVITNSSKLSTTKTLMNQNLVQQLMFQLQSKDVQTILKRHENKR